jgi:hypothetical protein
MGDRRAQAQEIRRGGLAPNGSFQIKWTKRLAGYRLQDNPWTKIWAAAGLFFIGAFLNVVILISVDDIAE